MTGPVAVTGAAGFVGRVTCAALVQRGIAVRALVRTASDAERLPSGTTVIPTGDLATANNLDAALSGCDAVIHLAARTTEQATPKESDPFATNVTTTERVCRAAARSGVKRFVLVSSVKAVAELTVDAPMTTTSIPAPTGPYGKSKLAAEQAAKRIAAELGLEIVIVRPPVVYGPGVSGNFAALIALARISRWIPLPLAGIENRRSMLFVGNLADALATVTQHPRAAGETFFVTDGPPLSTATLIRSTAAALGGRAKLFAVSSRTLLAAASAVGARSQLEKLTASLEADDAHFRRVTAWVPLHDFNHAIALTVRAGTSLVSQVTPS